MVEFGYGQTVSRGEAFTHLLALTDLTAQQLGRRMGKGVPAGAMLCCSLTPKSLTALAQAVPLTCFICDATRRRAEGHARREAAKSRRETQLAALKKEKTLASSHVPG